MSDPNRPGPRVPTTPPPDDPRLDRPADPRGGRGRADHPRASSADTTTVTTPSVPPPGSAVSGSLPADAPSRPVRVSVARRGPRRARLVIKHIDPWTVMKVTFVVSVVILVVVVVAVTIIYAVLGKMGVWDQINNLVNSVAPTTASKTWHNPLSGSRIIGITAAVGAINVVLMTALCTLGAAIYNLISDLVGGIEVTLSDP